MAESKAVPVLPDRDEIVRLARLLREPSTPRPWVVGWTYDDRSWPTFRLRDMEEGSGKEATADAELIQQAVNMAESLIGIALYLTQENVQEVIRLAVNDSIESEKFLLEEASKRGSWAWADEAAVARTRHETLAVLLRKWGEERTPNHKEDTCP